MNSFVSRRTVVLFLLATGGALSLSDAEAAAGSTIMGSGGDGDQLPQSSNTLLSTSSRSSLVDHPWLETFFSCPSTPPPPSSYQTSRPPDTATLTSVFTDAATSELAPLVVGGVLGAVTLPALAVPLLGVLGFSSAGVAAYSIAAALQTSQVAAGSWFALCQSAGALGVASGPIVVAASSAGAVIGGGLGAAVERVPTTIVSLVDLYGDLVDAVKAATTSSMHHAASKLFNAEAIA